MSQATLVIVPCGAQKVWATDPKRGEVVARDAYTSSLFKLHRRYAELHGAAWRILSAKYGWLNPLDKIENYDQRFHKSTAPRFICDGPKDTLRRRANAMLWILEHNYNVRVERVVLLGGELYRDIAREALHGRGIELVEPFAGLGLFKLMKALKESTEEARCSF